MKGHVRIALALAALFAANLALDTALVYIGAEYAPAGTPAARRPPVQIGPILAKSAQLGTFVSQAVLLGYWLALGDAKWYWRLSATIALMAAMGVATWTGYALSPALPPGGTPIWNIVVLRLYLLMAVSLTVVLAAAPLRELRGWRLAWQSAPVRPAPRHLHIADILLWMVPFGGLLAMVRFLAAHGLEFGPSPGRFVLRFAGVTVVAAAMGLGGFLHPLQRLGRRLNYVALFVMVGLSIAEFYLQINQLRVRTPGMPLLPTGSPGTFDWGPSGMISSYAIIMWVARVNSQVLRRLGCKLIGPSEELVYGLKLPQQHAA